MEFNKKYNRSEFVGFLQHKFLPEDFVVETTAIRHQASNEIYSQRDQIGLKQNT